MPPPTPRRARRSSPRARAQLVLLVAMAGILTTLVGRAHAFGTSTAAAGGQPGIHGSRAAYSTCTGI